MKLLKRIIFLLTIIIILLINVYTKDNKIYYISLGDGLSLGVNSNNYISNGYSDYIKEYLENNKKLKFYTKEFSKEDARITDIINDIKNNREITIDNKKITLQYALSKSNIITISFGLNEILYKYSNNTNMSYMYDYIDNYIEDMDKLLELIRKYNSKAIFILGYYNPINHQELDKYIIYANDKLINLCNKNKTNYVDLYNIFKNNNNLIYNINNSYPNSDGYKLIANEILKKL